MISKKEKIAILQVLAIKEGLTSTEYANVIAEVNRISVVDIFSENKIESSTAKSKRDNVSATISAENVLNKLKLSDPDKYILLNDLKISIRSGVILKNFNDVKDFLARIDQVSLISTNKSSTVNNILIYLSRKNLNDIRDIIKGKIKAPSNTDDKGFNELANYIISPKK